MFRKHKYIEVYETPMRVGRLVFRKKVSGMSKKEIDNSILNLDKEYHKNSYQICVLTTLKDLDDIHYTSCN